MMYTSKIKGETDPDLCIGCQIKIISFKDKNKLETKSENDIARRNTIAKLLSDWGLVNIKGK